MSKDPEAILFTDHRGDRCSLEDVIADGLDEDYSDRVGDLEELLDHGTPYHGLLACVVLCSWGIPSGFRMLISWASAPDGAPWAGEPVVFAPHARIDGAFDLLADALRTSAYVDEGEELRELQRDAARRLLAIYPSHFINGAFIAFLGGKSDLRHQLAGDIVHTVDACIERIASGAEPGLDLPVRTAGLLGLLIAEDPQRAADRSNRLLDLRPADTRMLHDLAYALGAGTDEQSAKVLLRLRDLAPSKIEPVVGKALDRRGLD